MSKVISFPFSFIGKTYLGEIYRPYAIVSVYSKLRNKWQPLEMVIDTGADYTLLPKIYSVILGINLNKDCKREQTIGIGGSETVYQYKNLPIKIGNWQNNISAGFLDRNDIPSLLGRLGCLEDFHLVFQNKKSIFEFPQIIIKPSKDIFDLAGAFKPKKNKDKSPLQARSLMEKQYSRF